LSRDELFACFPEFNSFEGQCRFSNCSHTQEPDCALHAAADAGVISARRYESYRLLAKEMEETRR
jgi:ribosome biogenesis GTPase